MLRLPSRTANTRSAVAAGFGGEDSASVSDGVFEIGPHTGPFASAPHRTAGSYQGPHRLSGVGRHPDIADAFLPSASPAPRGRSRRTRPALAADSWSVPPDGASHPASSWPHATRFEMLETPRFYDDEAAAGVTVAKRPRRWTTSSPPRTPRRATGSPRSPPPAPRPPTGGSARRASTTGRRATSPCAPSDRRRPGRPRGAGRRRDHRRVQRRDRRHRGRPDDPGDPVDETMTITQTANGYVVSRAGGGLAAAVAPCTGGGAAAAVTCPFAASISVDLAGGNDTLTHARGDQPDADRRRDRQRPPHRRRGRRRAGRRRRRRHAGRRPGRRRVLRRGRQRRDRGARRHRRADRVRRRTTTRRATTSPTSWPSASAASTATATRSPPASTATTTNAAIHPGALDILENGVDEDCDGRDAVNLDRDGDGFAGARGLQRRQRRRSTPARSRSAATTSTRTATASAERFGLLRSLVLEQLAVRRRYSRRSLRGHPQRAQGRADRCQLQGLVAAR